MTLQRDDYTTANREAWNVSAQHHRDGRDWKRLTEGFARPGFSCLDTVETRLLDDLGVKDCDVGQLCCNNGRELLSVRNMGAARCVGFDQSEEFLAQGRELAALARQEIELVHSDIYKLGSQFDGAFDLVLITIGVFGWMPDLRTFMDIPARLLKPGGCLVIHEEHPMMNMFDPFEDNPHEPTLDYFRHAPLKEEGAIVYDGTATDTQATHWWFFHTLSDVMTAALGSGLALERFDEMPDNISTVEFDVYQERPSNMPMSYAMVWRQPNQEEN